MDENKEMMEGELVEEADETAEQEPTSEMDEMKALNMALVQKLQQVSADYENFRRRNEQEKTHMYDRGIMAFAEALLPVMDNFALATKNADPNDSFVKGVLMIQNQLNHIFEDMGMKPIAAVGEVFDTKLHSAISHIADETKGEQEIVEELQKGYIYKEVVLRHAVVVVAN